MKIGDTYKGLVQIGVSKNQTKDKSRYIAVYFNGEHLVSGHALEEVIEKMEFVHIGVGDVIKSKTARNSIHFTVEAIREDTWICSYKMYNRIEIMKVTPETHKFYERVSDA